MTGAAPERPHHQIDYVELGATDVAASRKFYEEAFQWQFEEYGPDYLGLKKIGGLCKVDQVSTGGLQIVLYSKDFEASLASAKHAGARIVKEIFPFPGGRRFQFLDPAGNELGAWTDTGGLEMG